MGQTEFELGSAEFEVLRVLWEHGPITVRQVLNHLHERSRRVAYTTVLTMLTRLEQKGYVASDKSDVAYVYRAAVTRDLVTRSKARKLVDQLYDGAAGALVLHLVRNERLSADEITELQTLIERLDERGRKNRKTF
ncbi:MAG: BlaI/MecI/CopY family transcriptional regulator [Phycisphaerales bacterium]|nr:BlaI/MecI/CopY family transcriptional regulator [Phycisphaerales bacterium]